MGSSKMKVVQHSGHEGSLAQAANSDSMLAPHHGQSQLTIGHLSSADAGSIAERLMDMLSPGRASLSDTAR